MSGITLHNDSSLSATYVSNQFIDQYMVSANGEYVKVYLYLLRCMSSEQCSFSISSAADLFEHTEKDIQRALLYWEKMKLLQLEYHREKKLSGIRLLAPEASKESGEDRKLPPAAGADADGAQGRADSADADNGQARTDSAGADGGQTGTAFVGAPSIPEGPGSYSMAQLSEFQKKEEVKELLFVTEHYLKRPLTSTDINTILFWYDELQFPVDLMEYLVEYCVGRGHTSLKYMNRVAISWKESGITTVERAKRTASAFSRLHFAVVRALGIQGRNLIPSETTMIDRWARNYGFSQELIEEACRRTIAATHQPNFDYADGILKSWHQQQVHNLTDVVRLDSTFQKTRSSANSNRKAAANKFNNFSQRSYDYEKLEQQLLGQRSRALQEELQCP